MRSLLGGAAGAGTIGGAIAANLSGPRRIKAGAARDHFLGVSAVSGRGETFKSGGRVVKNVTGYDLCKLLAGSWGTLAAMTDVTIKTLPRAETEETVLVLNLDDATARKAMAAAMGFVRRRVGAPRICRLPLRRGSPRPRSAGCGDGVPPRRRRAVGGAAQDRAADAAVAVRLARHARRSASRALWRAIRDVAPFAANGPAGTRDLWRISTAPTRGADVGPRARRASGRRAPLRLGRRARLGGVAAVGRRPRAAGARDRRGRRRPCDADPRAGRGARRGRCIHAGGAGACRIDASACARASIRKACSMPDACGRAYRAMQTSFTLAQLADPDIAESKKFCAPACIAASAPRPARPMCSTATSSIRRAGAST